MRSSLGFCGWQGRNQSGGCWAVPPHPPISNLRLIFFGMMIFNDVKHFT